MDGISNIDKFVRTEFGGDKNVRIVRIKAPGAKLQQFFGGAAQLSSFNASDLAMLQQWTLMQQTASAPKGPYHMD